MAILNYKIVKPKQTEEDKAKIEAQKKEAQDKQLRASKQSVVNNAMMTKIVSDNPGQTAPAGQNQGWGGVN